MNSKTNERIPSKAQILIGIALWIWIIGCGSAYLRRHPWGLRQWRRAREVWNFGEWYFPWSHFQGLLVCGVCILIAWGLGRVLGEIFDFWRGEPGEQAIATLGGLSLLGMGVLALGCVGFLHPISLIGLLCACGVFGWGKIGYDFLTDSAGLKKREYQAILEKPTRILCLLRSFGIAILLISCLAALAPATQSDGMRYHLFGPQEFLRAGRIFYIPHSAFTNFPFLAEMLFTLGLALSGDSAAKLFHWIHLPLGATVLYALTARVAGGRSSTQRISGGLAAVWFLSTPVASIVAGWSFVDLATTAYLMAMLWATLRWREEKRGADLWVSGFFAGAAIGSKYTCLAPAFFIALMVCLQPAPTLRSRVKRVLGFVLAGSICAAPWFIKNIILTGNPVYPLAYEFFGGGDWSSEADLFYKSKVLEKGMGRGGIFDFLWAPWDTAFHPRAFENQNPGPGYLLAFPWLVAWAGWWGWRFWKNRASAKIAPLNGTKGLPSSSDPDQTKPFKELSTSSATGKTKPSEGLPSASNAAQTKRRRRPFTISDTAFLGMFLLFCAGVFFAGYKSNRFLLPVWALTATLVCGKLGQGAWRKTPFRLLDLFHPKAAICAGILFSSAYGAHWTARYLIATQSPKPAIPAALGVIDRRSYLAASLNYYPCVEWLALHAQPGEKVFYVGEHRGYPSFVPVGVSDWFDTPLILRYIQETPDNDILLDRLLQEGYRYVLFNFAELALYEKRYFRPRFKPAEWSRFTDWVRSPRLKPRWPPNSSTYICEITARHNNLIMPNKIQK